jgi:aquaporin Z
MREYVMEFIGTFFLVLAIAITGSPIAIGLMLMAVVYMGGHISGAHYNPAITLTFLILKKITIRKSLIYITLQLLGGFVAAALSYVFTNKLFAPTPGVGVMRWQAMLLECLITFVLCAVVFTVAGTKKFQKSFIYGAVIGLTLTTLVFVGGSISGAAVNPAVAIGPMFFDFLRGGSAFLHYPVYLVGPFAGGALAALFCKFMND